MDKLTIHKEEYIGLFIIALYQTLELRSDGTATSKDTLLSRVKNIMTNLYPARSPSRRATHLEFSGSCFCVTSSDRMYRGDMQQLPSSEVLTEYVTYCRVIQDVNTVRLLKVLYPEFQNLNLQGIPQARRQLFIDCALLDDRGLPENHFQTRQKLLLRLSKVDYRTEESIRSPEGEVPYLSVLNSFMSALGVTLTDNHTTSLHHLVGEHDE